MKREYPKPAIDVLGMIGCEVLQSSEAVPGANDVLNPGADETSVWEDIELCNPNQ